MYSITPLNPRSPNTPESIFRLAQSLESCSNDIFKAPKRLRGCPWNVPRKRRHGGSSGNWYTVAVVEMRLRIIFDLREERSAKKRRNERPSFSRGEETKRLFAPRLQDVICWTTDIQSNTYAMVYTQYTVCMAVAASASRVSSDRSHVEADCHVGIELTDAAATRSTKRTKTSQPIN